MVIEFKRDVYQMALTELARFLPRGTHYNRYLRSGMRPHYQDDGMERNHHGRETAAGGMGVQGPNGAASSPKDPLAEGR